MAEQFDFFTKNALFVQTLNKCGFSLVSELSGYYTLTATNIVGIIGQICLKLEQEKVIIFGNTKLIKMLTHDLPKLQAMYNEQ